MNEPPRIEVHQDFVQVYDLADPRPYYRALAPTGYRMPDVVARFLRRNHALLCQAFGTDRPHLLDFACGFGAAAALARHGLEMDDLYAHYACDAAASAAGVDAAFFAAARDGAASYVIAGLDTARNALDYARACGLIDEAFDDDLLAAAPGARLCDFMRRPCLVYESGATLDVLQPALLALLDAGDSARPPWLLFSPRFDVDDRFILAELARRGYRVDNVNRAPIRYRRSIGPRERREHESRIRSLGRDPADCFDGDWIVVDLLLARPEAAARALPLERVASAD